MRRLYPFFTLVWIAVILAFAVSLSSAWIFESVLHNDTAPLWGVTGRYYGWVAGALVVLGIVTLLSRHDERQNIALSEFALVRRADQVTPGDLGFAPQRGIGAGSLFSRPYVEPYMERHFVRVELRRTRAERRAYSEPEVVGMLKRGVGMVLMGQPLAGKTRTLLELVRRMTGYLAVIPRRDSVPPAATFKLLFRKRRVIVLLDDLETYAHSSVQLGDFLVRLQDVAAELVVAATCRTGGEFEIARRRLQRLYAAIPMRLALEDPGEEAKRAVAEACGREWHVSDAGQFPTLGAVAIEDYLEAMRGRFDGLTVSQKEVLRAIHLLYVFGLEPITRERLGMALGEVLGHDTLDITEALQVLRQESFLRSDAGADPIAVEVAYLEAAVPEGDASGLEDEGEGMRAALVARRDADGLLAFGGAAFERGEYEQARASCERALEFAPDFVEAWNNKGVALHELGRLEEAMVAVKRAIEIEPDFLLGWENLGPMYLEARRFHEGTEAFERVVQSGARSPEALYGLGHALTEIGEPERALEALDEAIRLDPTDAVLWIGKGIALASLDRFDFALNAIDRGVALAPESWEAHLNRARVLKELGRYWEAVAAYKECTRLNPSVTMAWYNMGKDLTDYLGHHEEAIEALDRALKLDPNDALVWGTKGNALSGLFRPWDALEAYKRGAELAPDNVGMWSNQGAVLAGDLGLFQQAVDAYDRAIAVDPGHVPAWQGKGFALAELGPDRRQEALTWLCWVWKERHTLPDHGAATQALLLRHFAVSPQECARLLGEEGEESH